MAIKKPLLIVFCFLYGAMCFSQEEKWKMGLEMSPADKKKAEKLNIVSDFTISYDSINAIQVFTNDSLNGITFENIKIDSLQNTLTFYQISDTNSDLNAKYTIYNLSDPKFKVTVIQDDNELSFKGYKYKYCTNHLESHQCRMDHLEKCTKDSGCTF